MWPNRKVIGGMFNPALLSDGGGEPWIRLSGFWLHPGDGVANESGSDVLTLIGPVGGGRSWASFDSNDMELGNYELRFAWTVYGAGANSFKIGITDDGAEISSTSLSGSNETTWPFEAIATTQWITFSNEESTEMLISDIFLRRVI